MFIALALKAKAGGVAQTCDPRTSELEAGDPKFKVSLCHTVQSCLTNKIKIGFMYIYLCDHASYILDNTFNHGRK